MEVIIQPNADQIARLAATFIAHSIRKKPNLVLGLATGSTPLLLYKELIRRHRNEGLDFSQVTTFNLDEYIGLAPDHPASYHYYMNETFFAHVNLQRERTHIPDGLASDLEAHCRLYEAKIEGAGGIDIQILGIGTDGHIGFNEPSSSLASRTRTKTLASQTRKDNARFFPSIDDVPRKCITTGIGTILSSRTCLLIATGKSKADAVEGAIEGPITSMNPASALQMHPDARMFVDEEAASKLKHQDYYRESFANSRLWQSFR